MNVPTSSTADTREYKSGKFREVRASQSGKMKFFLVIVSVAFSCGALTYVRADQEDALDIPEEKTFNIDKERKNDDDFPRNHLVNLLKESDEYDDIDNYNNVATSEKEDEQSQNSKRSPFWRRRRRRRRIRIRIRLRKVCHWVLKGGHKSWVCQFLPSGKRSFDEQDANSQEKSRQDFEEDVNN